MKFTASTLLNAILSMIAAQIFPWWCVVLVGFTVAHLVVQSLMRSFLAAFVGVFLLWAVVAWWIDTKNEHILSSRIAEMISLNGNIYLLIILSALINATVAGLGALSGSSLVWLMRAQKPAEE